jgi:hypothetical protein
MCKLLLRVLVVFAVSFLGISCKTRGSTTWQATADGVVALHKDLVFPRYLSKEDAVKQGDEFDVNRYFSVLTHLSMQPGYVLDYIYHYDGMGGFPLLYARPTDQAPYNTESEFTRAMQLAAIEKTNEQYLPYLVVEDTSEGYYEYVVFRVMAAQFYLFWHAAYNDRQIVADGNALNRVLTQKRTGYAIPITASLQARLLDLTPIVTLDSETVKVQVITFSAWQGFVQEIWTIDRRNLHNLISVDSRILVPYNCGIMF